MMAEYELAPWGERAGDYRNAVLGLGIAKAALHNPVNSDDFKVDFTPKAQTQDQMRAVMRGLAGRKVGA